MTPLESMDLSPIARTQSSQPVPAPEKSDDQNSHGELPHYENRHENLHFHGHGDEQVQHHIATFLRQEFDPT